MTRHLEVQLALKALVQAALPGAKVLGFDADASAPSTIGTGGCVIGDLGEPGDPELDLGPPSYNWHRTTTLDFAAANGAGGADLDAMFAPVVDAILADRFLGGLVDYLDCGAPMPKSQEGQLAGSVNWASLGIYSDYATASPAG